MRDANATPYVLTLDLVGNPVGSPPFPHQAVLPGNYYIVIDTITLFCKANAASNCGVDILTDEALPLASLTAALAASEAQTLHVTFPKGLVIPRASSAPGTGQMFGKQALSNYGNTTIFNAAGDMTTCRATITYRYVAPSALGL